MLHEEDGVDIIGKKMTLLGAGGAATAILVQAALDGVAEINVFNVRDNFFGRAEEIVAKLNERTECKVTLHDFSDPEVLRASIAESTILVNGTSVGMAPNVDRTIITDTSMFHKDLFVFDVIYNPQETRLLREAKEAGCKTGTAACTFHYQSCILLLLLHEEVLSPADYYVYLEARSRTVFPRKCIMKHAISWDWIIHILHLMYRKIKCRRQYRDFVRWEQEDGISPCQARTLCVSLQIKYPLHLRFQEHVILSLMTMGF